ncbi:HNH endonuclease [bacterium]|nr:HNH endonuclease [bacterium]
MKRIYHKHHIVPKHMGGTDDKSNLQKLTIKQHADAHKKLYEQHGHWQDKVAYETLSGQHDRKESIREVRIASNKNRWNDPIWAAKTKKKMREAALKRIKKYGAPISKNFTFKGGKHSEEYKKKRSENKKEYWSNDENRQRISKQMKEIRKNILWNRHGRTLHTS